MKCTAVLFASLILAAGAAGCATTSSEGGAAKEAPAKSEKAVQQAPAIPASSPFSRVRMGMPRAQVDDLIGQPTSTRVFPSGKSFIPVYYGPDTMRTAAMYKGMGTIVFTGDGVVNEIVYDPTEDGY